MQSILGTGGWFGAVHNLYCQEGRCSPYLVLLGGSVQSIFGTAGWFGAVHIWYCQVVCCSPCLVLPGDLVQPILGNTECFFCCRPYWGTAVWCVWQSSVCTAEWMLDAV